MGLGGSKKASYDLGEEQVRNREKEREGERTRERERLYNWPSSFLIYKDEVASPCTIGLFLYFLCI